MQNHHASDMFGVTMKMLESAHARLLASIDKSPYDNQVTMGMEYTLTAYPDTKRSTCITDWSGKLTEPVMRQFTTYVSTK